MVRKKISSLWDNYKFRFVPWLIYNLRNKKPSELNSRHEQRTKQVTDKKFTLPSLFGEGGSKKRIDGDENSTIKPPNNDDVDRLPFPSTNNPNAGPLIVHHVSKGEDKMIKDGALVDVMILLFEKFLEAERNGKHLNAKEISKRNKEIMHNVLGYSIERQRSQVAEDAGTGVFLTSGQASPGDLIALYPGTIYMPLEPLFFPSIGNPYIFRCSDGVHIDGNDKWISKSIYKSCSARDKFGVTLPCCDDSWLTASPINPLNIGQYVNNRSRSAENNVVYQESSLVLSGIDSKALAIADRRDFPIYLCKYLPNIWANPENNHHPLRLVPLVATKEITKGDEVLSSYFTLVHTKENEVKSL